MLRGVARARAVEVGGLEAGVWFKMYAHTHHGMELIAWPDGRSYLEQSNMLVEVFDLIEAEARAYVKEKRDSDGKRR